MGLPPLQRLVDVKAELEDVCEIRLAGRAAKRDEGDEAVCDLAKGRESPLPPWGMS